MPTTTVRLDQAEERMLDELAAVHGGRSNALREGLRLLAASARQRIVLAELLDDWDPTAQPVDDDTIATTAARYGL